ncbi:MAG: peptidylprolyl isomerase [Thermonemataceae bacterium]|nr:peptidylprolyl isomerase [Thermonemataceae bacterium]
MALIGKIREKSTGLVLGLIAFGLMIFIIGGDDLARLFGRGTPPKVVGIFKGKEITAEDLKTEMIEAQNLYLMNTGKVPAETDLLRSAWQLYVNKNMTQKEYAALGISVSEKEKEAMVQGDSIFIHPQIRNTPTFQDSVTKKFNKNLVKEFLKQTKTNPELKARWEAFKDGLAQEKLQQKYNTILSQSTYVTKAEAKREYENQNNKLTAKYLYIPFSSIPDSTLKVSEEELVAYLKQHKKRFKAPESRSIEYVIFSVAPSKEDSTEFADELRKLSKDFATAKNDSVFALSKTKGSDRNFTYRSPKDVPDGVYSEDRPLLKGAVVGPFLYRNSYWVVKVSDVKEDSTYFTRSKHILFQVPKGADAKIKDSIRKKAEGVLAQLREGKLDFAKAVLDFGSDGTRNTGGDLGWYDEKTMVAPFAKASFAAKEKGLLSELVETEYGFHILKITEVKTNKKYKLAVIERPIIATQETTDDVSLKAQEFLLGINGYEDFKKKVEKNPALVKKVAKKLSPYAQAVDGITANAKPLISWAFNEAKINEVPKQPIRIAEQGLFVVPILTAKNEKDEASLEYFREQVEYEVKNEKKKEIILKKLKGYGNISTEEMAKKYGNGATASEIKEVSMQNATLGNAGFSPIAVGKAFGLAKGKRSQAFADENGVVVVEVTEKAAAAQIADYTQYKTNLLNTRKQSSNGLSYQALLELYKVQDLTYRLN